MAATVLKAQAKEQLMTQAQPPVLLWHPFYKVNVQAAYISSMFK
jgi:hypothetical protein